MKEVNEAKSEEGEERREETRSVCRVEERQKVRPSQLWTRAVCVCVCVCMAITERYYRATLRKAPHTDALLKHSHTEDGTN